MPFIRYGYPSQAANSSKPTFTVAFRQPLTESNASMTDTIQKVMDALKLTGAHLVFGDSDKSGDTFKEDFTKTTGLPFSPEAFREVRLNAIASADLFVFLRLKDVLSESGSFETGYIYRAHQEGLPVPPVLILQERGSDIKTTLLRNMENASYLKFDPNNISSFLVDFKLTVLPKVLEYQRQCEKAVQSPYQPAKAKL